MNLAMNLIVMLLKAATNYELNKGFDSLVVEGWHQEWAQ